jgi:hypothetical protein
MGQDEYTEIESANAESLMQPEQRAVMVALMLVEKSYRLLTATPFVEGTYTLESPFNPGDPIMATTVLVTLEDAATAPSVTYTKTDAQEPAQLEILGTLVIAPDLRPILLHDAENDLSVDAQLLRDSILEICSQIESVQLEELDGTT